MSIFKSTFKPYVTRQILARQDVLSSESRQSHFSRFVSGKAPFIRMTSLVDYKGTSNLAKDYILYGGTAIYNEQTNRENLRGGFARGDKRATTAYGNLGNRMYGIRPMPGIESAEIRTISAYGSLKEATVNFYAWDKKQLEDLEILFMRPGYFVFLEWGWSMYLDTALSGVDYENDIYADYNNKPVSIPVNDINIKTSDARVDVIKQVWNENDLYDKIDRMRQAYSGNYDAILGRIKNFSWEIMPNGGYQCSTTLISIGEVIDSLKISNVTAQKFETPENSQEVYQATTLDLFFDMLSSDIASLRTNPLFNQYVTEAAKVPGIHADVIKKVKFAAENNSNPNYIQFAFFIYMLNSQINYFNTQGLSNKNNRMIIMEIPVYNKRGISNGLCVASEDSISVNPNVCLIQNKKATFVCGDPRGFDLNLTSPGSNVPYKEYLHENTSLGVIGNIYFSVNFLKNTYRSLLKNGDVKLGDFLLAILNQANIALGNINEFGYHIRDNKIAFIDAQYTEEHSDAKKSKKFEINLSGNNTAVRNSKIESKIFPSQANLIALAAQKRENVGSINTSTNVMLNKDLINRIAPEVLEFSQKTEDLSKTEEERVRKEQELIINNTIAIRDYVANVLSPDQGKGVIYQDVYPNMSSVLKSIILKVNKDANYKAIIPISLNVEFEGISGIYIGEIFRVNQDILPTSYNSANIGFIVTGLKDVINKQGWLTELTTQICLLEQDSLKKNADVINIDKTQYSAAIVKQTVQNSDASYKALIAYNFLVAYIQDYFAYDGLLMDITTLRRVGVQLTDGTLGETFEAQSVEITAIRSSSTVMSEANKLGVGSFEYNIFMGFLKEMGNAALVPLNGTDGQEPVGPIRLIRDGQFRYGVREDKVAKFTKDDFKLNKGKSTLNFIPYLGLIGNEKDYVNFANKNFSKSFFDQIIFPFLKRQILNSSAYNSMPSPLQSEFIGRYDKMINIIKNPTATAASTVLSLVEGAIFTPFGFNPINSTASIRSRIQNANRGIYNFPLLSLSGNIDSKGNIDVTKLKSDSTIQILIRK